MPMQDRAWNLGAFDSALKAERSFPGTHDRFDTHEAIWVLIPLCVQ